MKITYHLFGRLFFFAYLCLINQLNQTIMKTLVKRAIADLKKSITEKALLHEVRQLTALKVHTWISNFKVETTSIKRLLGDVNQYHVTGTLNIANGMKGAKTEKFEVTFEESEVLYLIALYLEHFTIQEANAARLSSCNIQ